MIWLGVATISQREPSLLIMLPFAILVISIAIAPIILQHRWERYYHKVCLGLAAFVGGYYLLARHDAERVLHAGFEYVRAIAALLSIFYIIDIWRHREVALLRQTQFDLHVDHARCADRISTDLARGRYRGMRNHVLLLDASAYPRGERIHFCAH